ncbi:MAG: pentapeptide repeat-containing protein, partial [bacterium]
TYKRWQWDQLLRTKCCRNCILVKAPLSRIDLTDADLRGADLRGADFKQATLLNVRLPEPEKYRGADFSGAMWVDGRICKPGSISFCRSD